MRILDRYILRELFGPFLNSVLMFLMLLFAAVYFFPITDFLVQGVPLGTILRLTLYTLPELVTQTLPMSVLLANLLAFGRLSGDSEQVAIFASGVSFMRLARPVAIMGLAVSLLTFVWNETVVPPAKRAFYEVRQTAVEKVQAINQPLQYVIKRDDGTVDEWVYIEGGYDARTKQLRKVTIVKMSDDPKWRGKPEAILYADWAIARDERGLDWEYHNVTLRQVRPDPDSRNEVILHMDSATTSTLGGNVRIGKDFRGVMRAEVTDNRRMTFRQLRDKINEERSQGNPNTLGDEVDLWEKLSLPSPA